MERILITGALGQLGQEFIKFFNKNNTYVLATDIRSPLKVLSCDFEIADAMDEKRIDYLIKKNNINVVYHLVAVLSANGEKNPFMAWEINMKSFQNIINLSINNGIKKIFWPSSIAVFGPTTPRDNTPQTTVMEPTTVYGISKLAGERWCEYFWNKFGVDVRSIRYPGLISYKAEPGGGTTDYAVDIYYKALQQGKYECYLEDNTYLPMMYMEDAIKATIDLMHADKEKIKIRSSYNLAGISFSPVEIAKEIQKHIPDFTISYAPDFRLAIANSWPKSINDTRAQEDWGWKNSYELDSMTEEMLKGLKEKLG